MALGWPNPDALKAAIPHRVYLEWLAYYRQEPFGEERADVRMGMLAAHMANMWAREKGDPPYDWRDFVPRYGGEPEADEDPERLLKKAAAINALMGGAFVKLEGW